MKPLRLETPCPRIGMHDLPNLLPSSRCRVCGWRADEIVEVQT